MARIVRTTAHEELVLSRWQTAVAEAPLANPSEEGLDRLRFVDATAPGTTAAALERAGLWKPGVALDLDSKEVWWRCRFPGDPGPEGTRVLRFYGLATLADAFLNGEHILHSESMFQSHEVDVGSRLAGSNLLLLRFSPLSSELRKKRPRPRFKASLVGDQQLRFVRTTLLGRMPSWPIPAPVGPWRPVVLERRGPLSVLKASLSTTLEEGDGKAQVALRILPHAGQRAPRKGTFQVGDASSPLSLSGSASGHLEARASVRLRDVKLWWPSTHGDPSLYPVAVEFEGGTRIDLGRVGFRSVEVDREDGAFSLKWNGVPVFCRGATWVPPDIVSLNAPLEKVRAFLERAVHGGMNMIRLAGYLSYETSEFHALCDELGILVWQDLMFAAMDYPGDDPGFRDGARSEATEVADDLESHPSLAILCGGTDSFQIASYHGLDPGPSRGNLFEEVLKDACRSRRPDVPYLENDPYGGNPPSHIDTGVSHWFGVGAYLRPLDDARRSRVRFAAECLAFSNVPEDELLESLPGIAPVAHPGWKSGVPRDAATAWDFDDVRDHYFELLHGLRPERLRREDPERYLALSRLVTGEVMETTFAELRSNGTCAGALVLALADFVPGAGWGLLDSRGVPKAAYWLLRQALLPVALLVTDEGLNGFHLHAVNDLAVPVEGTVEVGLLRGEVEVARGALPITVPARGQKLVRASEAIGRFTDETRAHRFGPATHDALVARLRDQGGKVLSEAVVLVSQEGRGRVLSGDPELKTSVDQVGPELFSVRIEARRLGYGIRVEADPPCDPEERYVHVVPGSPRLVRVRVPPGTRLRGMVRPVHGVPARFSTPEGNA